MDRQEFLKRVAIAIPAIVVGGVKVNQSPEEMEGLGIGGPNDWDAALGVDEIKLSSMSKSMQDLVNSKSSFSAKELATMFRIPKEWLVNENHVINRNSIVGGFTKKMAENEDTTFLTMVACDIPEGV